MPKPRRPAGAITASLAAALVAFPLAACGTSGTEQASGPVTVAVAETEGTPSAFLAYGADRGFFEREDLSVTVSPGAGGAANVPKLVSGDVQFAGSNVVSVLLANAKGLPLRMVAGGTAGTDSSDHGYQSVMAGAESDVSSLEDLRGRTVAVNTLDNIDEVLLKAALDRSGVDPDEVELTEVPFPQMPQSLQANEVDAVRVIEPFATQAAKDGARFLPGGTAGAVKPGLQIGSYVTTAQYLEENPEAVRGFVAGVEATARAIEEDPQRFREFLVEHADMSPQLANEIVLPTWHGGVDLESLELIASLMAKYGISEGEPDIDGVVADLGTG